MDKQTYLEEVYLLSKKYKETKIHEDLKPVVNKVWDLFLFNPDPSFELVKYFLMNLDMSKLTPEIASGITYPVLPYAKHFPQEYKYYFLRLKKYLMEESNIDETEFNVRYWGFSRESEEFQVENFAIDLWSFTQFLMSKNRKCEALVFLYEGLRQEVNKKNYTICNDFLIYMKDQKDIGTDCIVHILNIISVVKKQLPFWDTFVQDVTERLLEQVGEDETKTLLKVIL